MKAFGNANHQIWRVYEPGASIVKAQDDILDIQNEITGLGPLEPLLAEQGQDRVGGRERAAAARGEDHGRVRRCR